MTYEEMVKKLEENDVDIDDIISDEHPKEWEVIFEDLSDMGSIGGYPISTYENTVEAAMKTAIDIIQTSADVFCIRACW